MSIAVFVSVYVASFSCSSNPQALTGEGTVCPKEMTCTTGLLGSSSSGTGLVGGGGGVMSVNAVRMLL